MILEVIFTIIVEDIDESTDETTKNEYQLLIKKVGKVLSIADR